MDTNKFKEKLRKIIPTLELLKSSYESENFYYEKSLENSIKYFLDLGHEYEVEYFSDYRERIQYLMDFLEKEIKFIKEIYLDNYNEINASINKRLQWIAIVITLIALFQAFFQCSVSNERKNINDEKKYEFNETICKDKNDRLSKR